ncbi:MAG: SDR family oxidoreductase, partial [Campylobacterota bacterium]|nr:SDR family oxidoreductase [Campylobacterota bacterium]
KKSSFIYGATKGAIGQITKSLALDYAENNVRVNCVCPATIDTPLSRKVLQSYADTHHSGNIEKVMELEAEEFPLGRIGNSKEVAKAVFFLASDASSFTTGSLLPVDGGFTAQ